MQTSKWEKIVFRKLFLTYSLVDIYEILFVQVLAPSLEVFVFWMIFNTSFWLKQLFPNKNFIELRNF